MPLKEGVLKPLDTVLTARACDGMGGALRARDLSRTARVTGHRIDEDIERDCLILRDAIHDA